MNQNITISLSTLLWIIFICYTLGISGGAFLIYTYIKKRTFKTKAQKELQRLAQYIEQHYPHVREEEGPLVDKVMGILSSPNPKESWNL